MNFLKKRARLLLCCFIILAFFVPAYDNISGFGFVRLAFTESENNSEIKFADILIIIVPLLALFLSALVILLRTVAYLPTRRLHLTLPLLFLLSFFGVMYISGGNTAGNFSHPRVFLQMQPGFYITAFASLLLVFTRDYKKKKHRKRKPVPDAQEAAAAA